MSALKYGPGPGHWWDELSENPSAPSQKPQYRWIYLLLYILLIIGVGIALYMIFSPTIGLPTPTIGN